MLRTKVLESFLIGVNTCPGSGDVPFALHGTIQSLNYPAEYNDWIDCSWVLRTDACILNITFIAFSVENEGSCGYDFLSITSDNTNEK